MHGAELPLPKNAKENEKLANMFKAQATAQNLAYHKNINNFAGFWLRLDDSAEEGIFVDSETKVNVTYFNWYPGMPNNWAGSEYSHIDEDYVVMYETGQWNDVASYKKAHTVCQKKIKA